MPSQYYSADHIAGAMGGWEPVRKNNFLLSVSPPGGGERILRLAVEVCSMPSSSSEIIAVNAGNEVFKVASTQNVGEITLTLKDFVDQKVAKSIAGWRKRVFNPSSGKVGLPPDYKVTGTMAMLSPGDGSRAQNWRVMNMWPSRVAYGEGNMSDNSLNFIQVVFTADRIENIG